MGGNIEGSLIIDDDDSFEMKRCKLIKALTDSNWDQFLAKELVGLKVMELQHLVLAYGIRRPRKLKE
jgi:hypothetical protein